MQTPRAAVTGNDNDTDDDADDDDDDNDNDNDNSVNDTGAHRTRAHMYHAFWVNLFSNARHAY